MNRKIVLSVVLLMVLPSCFFDKELEFQNKHFENVYGSDDGNNSPYAKVTVNIPQVVEGDKKIKKMVNEELIRFSEEKIALFLPDNKSEVDGLEKLVQVFLGEYDRFRTAFPTSAQQWFIDVSGAVAYSSEDIVTVTIETKAYTGGAHGFSSVDYLMFSHETGARIGLNGIISDRQELLERAEVSFRRTMKLGSEDDLQAAGFWFKDNIFSITDNAGVTSEGLIIQYNPYEIANYVTGAIKLVLTYDELSDILTVSP